MSLNLSGKLRHVAGFPSFSPPLQEKHAMAKPTWPSGHSYNNSFSSLC